MYALVHDIVCFVAHIAFKHFHLFHAPGVEYLIMITNLRRSPSVH